jgi:uncharacterized membrane protein YkoI
MFREDIPMMRSGLVSALPIAAVLGFGGCATVLSELEPYREVVCVQYAKVSLKGAVASAEAQGRRVIDAHYHQGEELGCLGNKLGRYDLKLLTDGKLDAVSVDASSGEVFPARQGRSNWKEVEIEPVTGFDFESNSTASESIARSNMLGLPDAIALAETTNGKVLKVRIDTKNGRPGYEIKLVEHGKVRTVWLDRNSAAAALARSNEMNPVTLTRGFVGMSAVSFLIGEGEDEEGSAFEEENETDG